MTGYSNPDTLFIHSFIPDIYIAPLQETYSEALSVQLRPKRNVLRSLEKEDTLTHIIHLTEADTDIERQMTMADDNLFRAVIYNDYHVLRHLFHPKKCTYDLHPRTHNFTVPGKYNNNYIPKVLYGL